MSVNHEILNPIQRSKECETIVVKVETDFKPENYYFLVINEIFLKICAA